jgi:hypothetical protein
MSEAERIAQIKDRVDATTYGSWEVLSREIVSSLPRWGKTGPLHATVMSLVDGRERWFDDEDAAFIEAAKEDVLWLLDQLSSALRAQENEPLTLEQLRVMEGEPIWTVTLGVKGSGRYELCTAHALNLLPLRCVTADGEIHDCDQEAYGKTWIAYPRKPKGDTK